MAVQPYQDWLSIAGPLRQGMGRRPRGRYRPRARYDRGWQLALTFGRWYVDCLKAAEQTVFKAGRQSW